MKTVRITRTITYEGKENHVVDSLKRAVFSKVGSEVTIAGVRIMLKKEKREEVKE
jgi:hypothetical protein